MIKIEINFLPKTQNEIINLSRKNKFLANKSKKEDENKVFWELRRQFNTFPKFDEKVYVYVDFYTTFRRDSDNLQSCLKPVFDVFQKQGIIKNDNLNNLEVYINSYNKVKKNEERLSIFIHKEKKICYT